MFSKPLKKLLKRVAPFQDFANLSWVASQKPARPISILLSIYHIFTCHRWKPPENSSVHSWENERVKGKINVCIWLWNWFRLCRSPESVPKTSGDFQNTLWEHRSPDPMDLACGEGMWDRASLEDQQVIPISSPEIPGLVLHQSRWRGGCPGPNSARDWETEPRLC